MRGDLNPQPAMFSYVDMESRIPEHHPIRKIRRIVDKALASMEPCFDEMYSLNGRPSIPPEMLIRASLLQIFYTIRSERQLIERINYDLLFRWFVGLSIDEAVWNHSTFSKNRERLLAHNVDEHLFDAIKNQAYAKKLMSREHFTVDGTLLEACAGIKSFKSKNPNPEDDDDSGENFHGHKRKNDTHESTTDPDTRLFRKGKGKEAKLSYMGHILTENRNGMIVEADASLAGTSQEWDVSVTQLARQGDWPGRTVGADKGYDVADFVYGARGLKITPHVAAKVNKSHVDARTTSTDGYAISQTKRKRVEECFGWMKTVGLMHKLRHRGIARVNWMFRFTAAAYNITRLRVLTA